MVRAGGVAELAAGGAGGARGGLVARRPAAESDPTPTLPSERGTGVIGTMIGFAVFLVLLLVAVQVLFDLYARSAATAAAFDAARTAAGYDVATLPQDQLIQAEADAEAQARLTLCASRPALSF